jgi:hypothetical protein
VDGQEAALVVMGVEQGELLGAVNHVHRVVDVEGHRLGRPLVALAPGVDHGVGQADDGLHIRRVLPARHGGLRAEILAAVGQAPTGQLERRVATQTIEIVGVLVAAGDGQHPRPQDRGHRVGDKSRIAPVGEQSSDPIDDADPAVGQGQQRHPAIGGDAPAVEGRAHLLARHAWQIEQKTAIVVHGGRGASGARKRVGVSNRILIQNNALRYVRQPIFQFTVNKTG